MIPIVQRFLETVARHAPEYHKALNPPAEDAETTPYGEALTAWIGLHQVADGTNPWVSLVQGLELLSLNSSRRIKAVMEELEGDGTFDKWAPNEWWNPAWIPILDNRSYDVYVIDLEGYKGSTPGQILRWSKDTSARVCVAPSFDDWLTAFCDSIEFGELVWDLKEGGFHSPKHRLLDDLISAHFTGYPKHFRANTRLELGMYRAPKPVERIERAVEVESHIEALFWAPGQEAVSAIAWIDALQLLAVGQPSYGGALCPALSLVDPENGDAKVLIEEDEGGILEMVWIEARSELVYLFNGNGRSIRVWNAKTGQKRSLLENSWDTRMNDAFDAAGDLVLHAGKVVTFYDLNGGPARHAPFAPNSEVCAAFSKDATRVGIHLPGEPLRFCEVSNFEVVKEHPVAIEKPGKLALNSRGDCIVTDWYGRQLERLDFNGNVLPVPEYISATAVLWLDDEHWALGASGTLWVFDQAAKELYTDLGHTRARNIVMAWDEQSHRLFSAGSDGSIVSRTLRF